MNIPDWVIEAAAHDQIERLSERGKMTVISPYMGSDQRMRGDRFDIGHEEVSELCREILALRRQRDVEMGLRASCEDAARVLRADLKHVLSCEALVGDDEVFLKIPRDTWNGIRRRHGL